MHPEHSALAAAWSRETLAEYFDVASGVPVDQGEELTTLNAEERAVALTAAELRVDALVSALDSRDLARVAVDAVDRLYQAGTTLPVWSPDISGYIRATWAILFGELAKRGFRIHYVVEHVYPERIGRPLELYPDLFAAAGFDYVCPHVYANDLPDAIDAEVTPEGLAPFVDEGRKLAVERAREITTAGRHLAYIEIAPEPGVTDEVDAMVQAAAGTIGVHRDGAPGDSAPPRVTLARRGPVS